MSNNLKEQLNKELEAKLKRAEQALDGDQEQALKSILRANSLSSKSIKNAVEDLAGGDSKDAIQRAYNNVKHMNPNAMAQAIRVGEETKDLNLSPQEALEVARVAKDVSFTALKSIAVDNNQFPPR